MSHVVEDFAGICQRNVGVSIVFLEIVHHDSPVSLPDGSIREHVSLREPQLAVLGYLPVICGPGVLERGDIW